MSVVNILIDIGDINKKLNDIKSVTNQKFMNEFSKKRINEMRSRLNTTKQDVFNRKFKPLSESYWRWKSKVTGFKDMNIGILWGNMVNNFNYTARDNFTMIENYAEYSAKFNTDRQFFENAQQWSKLFIEDVNKEIKKVING